MSKKQQQHKKKVPPKKLETEAAEPFQSNFVSKNFGVRFYDLHASQHTLQEILNKSELKPRYNKQAKNYLQLIESLELPHATSCLRLTSNGSFLFASGSYPPQIRCYELEQLTLKFERHVVSDVLKLCVCTID